MSIRNIIKNALIYVFFIFSFLPQTSFANTLSNWQDPKAYKPRPVLLLHGFGLGSPASWQPSIAALSKWFSKYQIIGPYLETIDFQDPLGSVDTYPDSRAGWADKVKNKVNSLLSSTKYGFYTNKLNLVCHSMGGLAAREYLTNPKYPAGYVDKLILIGVPNLGAPLATYTDKFADVYKIGSFTMLPPCITMFIFRNNTDATAQYLFIPNIETSEALEDMSPNSNFLSTLNNRSQPPAVQYYGIYGIIGHFLNSFFFKDYYGGDGIVSKKSQLGEGRVTFFKAPRQIPAFHTAEPAISVAGDNPLLKFLDSTKPVLEITYPGSGTTEIYESSIHIQGKVYKEYLPADSQLIINVRRQGDGFALPTQTSFLKPSDLWIPNNPDSPVAEFDEVINFPGKGTYKISCQVKNPTGLTSAIKDVWVKVVVPEGTNIIIHCHNPEGKEIASIQGMDQNSVEIYDGNTLIGYGAYNAETHNKPIAISAGTHTIKAKFNGMIKEQTVTIKSNETKVITFTFERTEINVLNLIQSFAYSQTIQLNRSGDGYAEDSTPNSRFKVCSFTYSEDCGPGCDPNIPKPYSLVATLSYSFNGSSFLVKRNYSLVLKGEYTNWSIGYFFPSYMDFALWVNFPTSKEVNIPIQSFDNWFVQSSSTGYFPRFYFGYPPIYSAPLIIGGELSTAISAQTRYPTIFIYDALDWARIYVTHYFTYGSTASYGDSLLGNLQYAYMSSVPYDLTGSGI